MSLAFSLCLFKLVVTTTTTTTSTTTSTTTYYLLPTTYYLLPTTYYDLRPTTYDLRPTTYDLRPTTYYLLPTTDDDYDYDGSLSRQFRGSGPHEWLSHSLLTLLTYHVGGGVINPVFPLQYLRQTSEVTQKNTRSLV